jgi:hypothetical protein
MFKFLNFSLFIAAHPLVLEAASAPQNAPQTPPTPVATTQNAPVSNPTQESGPGLMPSPVTSNQNMPMTYEDKHIAKLKKCSQDFSGEDNKFARVQCMKYTDIGMTCEKTSNSSGDVVLSCVDKKGLEIEVPVSKIKEEIEIKKEAGALNSRSRLYKMYVKKTAKDSVNNNEKKETPKQEDPKIGDTAPATQASPTPETSSPQPSSGGNITPAALPAAPAGK